MLDLGKCALNRGDIFVERGNLILRRIDGPEICFLEFRDLRFNQCLYVQQIRLVVRHDGRRVMALGNLDLQFLYLLQEAISVLFALFDGLAALLDFRLDFIVTCQEPFPLFGDFLESRRLD